MHYSGPIQRVNQVDAQAKLDARIAKLRDDIKRGDDEVCAGVNPYNTFELMQRAQSWRHQRFRLSTELGNLERAKQWSSPDMEWRPAPNGFFVGSES
jgi:hypothetical protein